MKSGKAETSLFLQQWHEGNQEGLDALLERHLPWIRNQVRRRLTSLLRSKGDSVDYVQDAVVQFLRFGPRIMIANDAHFRGLLLRIVENTLRDKHDWFTAHRRNIARERPLSSDTVLSLDPPVGAVKTPSKSAERHEREAWVRLGMEVIDSEDREVVVLRRWEKQSFSEIGEHFGISSDASRMRYNRAVLKLGDVVLALRRGDLDRFLEQGSS